MRFALDSNILVYSLVRDDHRHPAALDLISRSAQADCILPVQALGEFLNVIRRKLPQSFDEACVHAERLEGLMAVVETRADVMLLASRRARSAGLQFWDSVLCEVVRSAGAVVLLSEDMQDGRDFDGLRIANPFAPRNSAMIAELLMPIES